MSEPDLVEAQFMVNQSRRMLEETQRRLRKSQLALAAATHALAGREASTPRAKDADVVYLS